jgi:hypothetical protein
MKRDRKAYTKFQRANNQLEKKWRRKKDKTVGLVED